MTVADNVPVIPTQVNRYRSRISGPLLDRIDIQVEVSNVDYDDLSSTENSETSAEIKTCKQTRKLQLERYKDYNIYSNSQLDAGMLKNSVRSAKKKMQFYVPHSTISV